jgi:formylglycine-generating enzyme required for sulfatase activity
VAHHDSARSSAKLAAQAALFGALFALVSASTGHAQLGVNYCAAVPNSTGAAAQLSAFGSAVPAYNQFALRGSGLPLNAAGYFLCSRTPSFTANPGGSAGNLCLGGGIGRLVGSVASSGSTGVIEATLDLSGLPQPLGPVAVQVGETWRFQCWHRDVVAGAVTSNFSVGLEVAFVATPTLPADLVAIAAGLFEMGSDAAAGAPYYGVPETMPVHSVALTAAFWMGRYEVTQAQYEALMGVNPSRFQGAGSSPMLPVEQVTWHDARAYCAALTTREAALGNVPPGYEYRLPTEAEWEYACRAGTTTEFHYGTDLVCADARFFYSNHANTGCNVPSTAATAPVGSYSPNAFGLFDMHGNVLEWCLDSFAPYPAGPVVDPFVTGGGERVLRGGAHASSSAGCRSAYRVRQDPQWVSGFAGFRVVLAPVRVP